MATWQKAVSHEHYLGEHFVLVHAQMNGAPNFGALSAVLLPMHAAYFTMYHVTTLYDVVVLRRSIDRERDALAVSLSAPFLASASHDMLVNMGRAHAPYVVFLNGRTHGTVMSDSHGHLTLRLSRPQREDELRIQPATLS